MAVNTAITGTAYVCDRSGKQPALVPTDITFTPPQKDDIIIRIHAAGMNRADLYHIDGHYPAPDGYDDVPGLEAAGIVEAAGPDATVSEGDAVCALLGAGGYATHARVSSAHTVAIPDYVSFTSAAAAPECYVTALHNITDIAGMKKGQRLFLHAAAGGLGPACIHTAILKGIIPYGVTRDPKKIPFMQAQGAHACYLYSDNYIKEFLRDSESQGAHAVFDCIGADTFSASMKIAADDGVVIILGFLSGAYAQTSLTRILTKRLRVIGSTVRYLSHDTKARLMREFSDDILPHLGERPAIDRIFPFEKATEAVKYMRSCAHAGKIVLQR